MRDPSSTGSTDSSTCHASHHGIHALFALFFRIVTVGVTVLARRIAVRRIALLRVAWVAGRSARRGADNTT